MIPTHFGDADEDILPPFIQIFFNMHDFCHPGVADANMTVEFRHDMENMKQTFAVLQVICCIIGVTGNILNIRTLQNPSLQSVPFMYIRSLAYFDLISLSLILIHFLLHFYLRNNMNNYYIMVYEAHFEAALINTFLIAGLYCAFMLTVERYTLISRPHFKPSVNPHGLARRKIIYVLLFSALIHTPMILQNKLKVVYNAQTNATTYMVSNNIELLCEEPRWTIFNYYKMARECLRFLCVIVMTALNIVIARELQINKKRRRRLVRRTSPSDPTTNRSNDRSSSSPDTSMLTPRREYTGVAKSFAERRLTVLMMSICIIFLLGNLPQIIVMLLQNEAMEHVYWFQLFRNVANLLEVLNHCLNFYVFCTASSEYTRAFLSNCFCLRRLVHRVPGMADFMAARRPSRYDSAMMSVGASGMFIPNRNFGSTDTIHERNVELVQTSTNAIRDSSTNSEHSDSRLKSILLSAERDRSEKKKSLTIVNHLVVPIDNEIDDTIEL